MPRKMDLEGPTEGRMAAGFRELLATHRVTQRGLSQKSGISVSVINRLVAGLDPLADCRKLFAVAKALGMNPVALLKEIGFDVEAPEPRTLAQPIEMEDDLSRDERLALLILRSLPRGSAARALAQEGLVIIATLARFGETNSRMVRKMLDVPGYKEELERKQNDPEPLESSNSEEFADDIAALFLEKHLQRRELDTVLLEREQHHKAHQGDTSERPDPPALLSETAPGHSAMRQHFPEPGKPGSFRARR